MRLVLATTNEGKLGELRRILAREPDLAGVELLSAADAGLPEVEETGSTFAENALLKARSGAAASGLPCLADDSGLEVDSLGGQPGVRSARYAGPGADDRANLELVLERMAGITDRGARFVCVAALAAPDGRTWTAKGDVQGELTTAPRGRNGFGYDPIFQPVGAAITTAEMLPDAKDAISHRGKAFRAIVPAVRAALGQSLPPMSTA